MGSRLEDAREVFAVAKEAHVAVEAAMVAADKAFSLAEDVLARAEKLAKEQRANRMATQKAFDDLKKSVVSE